jgi:hypothetical protein
MKFRASSALAVLGVAAGLALSTPSHANLLTNGSFEDPSIGTWYVNEPSGIPGWTVTANSVDVVAQGYNGPSAAYDGQQYLDLVGFGSTGGVQSQSFATVAGQSYLLTFAYANNPWSTSTASANVRVLDGTSNTLLFGEVTHSGSTTNKLGWSLFSRSFIADGTSSTIFFDETVGANSGGVMIDAVGVAAVPEPATWALMVLGFAGLGFMGYRQSHNRTRIAFA